MVDIVFDDRFKKIFSKIKDAPSKEKVLKQISKLQTDPEFGKPMRFSRKGTREVYISPYRLEYTYLKNEDKIILIDLYPKDEQ